MTKKTALEAMWHEDAGSISRFVHVHLQWFAAEDEGRTEEPTEHKIRKAREEGKVAKTPELPSTLVMLFTLITLALLSSYLFSTMVSMFQTFFSSISSPEPTHTGRFFVLFLQFFLKLTLPFFVVALCAGVAGNVLQVGFLFTVKPITPDLQRIVPNFSRFAKRVLFSTEALFNLGKTILKVAAIGFLAYLNIRMELPRLVNLLRVPLLQGIRFLGALVFRILFEATVVFLAISIVDYLFQRRQHLESLKMSREELKEERKMYEGDPLVKSRLRQRMREILTRNMIRRVPEADVVITNPTHYAVALEYERARMEAPTVVAKGADELALRMRAIAREHGVPLVENRPLARALYQEVEVGDTIPEQYYAVVATILAKVYAVDARRREKVM
ncbi:flagellar biosynthesis protein FlhB [Spirochaeta thermophila]|uniref:Flagellar biosynthetic protein FlhB n=1 Tax=Winmispira thermophila (strain ATCC 49972 / DSM 6192 / RI 19.B1) TaxID=665571 RepID=E0RS89_WINT6|nr:flagellar biosynthesis protein FlhB [Spirochaeta thermophila]ADN01876.1 hypothetical protein STHERM_c09290 [Spirochaeta thermophila DSM 6192]